jgi:hypothetical protein
VFHQWLQFPIRVHGRPSAVDPFRLVFKEHANSRRLAAPLFTCLVTAHGRRERGRPHLQRPKTSHNFFSRQFILRSCLFPALHSALRIHADAGHQPLAHEQPATPGSSRSGVSAERRHSPVWKREFSAASPQRSPAFRPLGCWTPPDRAILTTVFLLGT